MDSLVGSGPKGLFSATLGLIDPNLLAGVSSLVAAGGHTGAESVPDEAVGVLQGVDSPNFVDSCGAAL